MANIAIVNSKIAELNTDQALTLTASDETGANTAQKFVYTPTGRDSKICLGFQVAASHGTVTWSIGAGTSSWAGSVAKTGSTAQATTDIIQVETAKYMLTNGTIEITFTPASGKNLTTEHALKVFAIELQ